MSDYDYDGFEDEPPAQGATGPTLPGGISIQAAAALLLVAVLIATLYLFFGPEPDSAIAPEGGTPVGATSTVLTSATSRPLAVATTGVPTVVTAATTAPTSESPVSTVAAAGATAVGATTALPGTAVSSAAQSTPPSGLSDGGFVAVTGTDGFGMRYRFGPGLDTATIRIVDEGEVLQISGEPEELGGMRWWRLQDSLGNFGWAVEDYLVPAAPPSLWSPPIASPTFEADGP